jgi:hypothetical protein
MPKPARILFVGNSFTRIGDMPTLVTDLLSVGEPHVRYEAEMSVADGRGFHWHWREGDARERIGGGRFDFVVLQGSSVAIYPNTMHGREGYTPQAMAEYAGKFVELARRHGSQPILFATQAASGRAEDLRLVIEKYVELARGLDVPVALCGAAWQRARREAPDLRLDVDDDYCHQNRQGVYLNACVFYALFTGRTPEGLWPPARPSRRSGRPRPAGPSDEATARRLERLAWATVQEYAARGDVRVFLPGVDQADSAATG